MRHSCLQEDPKIQAIQENFKKHRQHGGRRQSFWKTLVEEVVNDHLRSLALGDWEPTQTPGRYGWQATRLRETIPPSQAPLSAAAEGGVQAKAVFVPRMFLATRAE